MEVGGEDFVVVCVDEFSGRVHGVCGFIAAKLWVQVVKSGVEEGGVKEGVEGTYFDDNNTIVKTNGYFVSAFSESETPRSFESVAQCVFNTVCTTIPDLDCTVFTSTHDDWEVRVEDSEGNIVGVAFHCLDATLGEVIPDFDGLVISSGDEVWFIRARVEVDIVYPFVVGFHGEVC